MFSREIQYLRGSASRARLPTASASGAADGGPRAERVSDEAASGALPFRNYCNPLNPYCLLTG